ncbi:ATP-dependent DNA helicase [Photobacterium chitinilyticum]|uniref:Exonuclease V subunit alpha n=1 Tax=Photobacterium chitinilyticum TaxID=2485123 RepID=A0A444JIA7_9GAMM|nr:ATP-dependent RecD-like DNA helicase [Photobacterium chitinilyticum]RWX52804.1 exonuclease V subunit alpha [Photobacterium chitinilyticum]
MKVDARILLRVTSAGHETEDSQVFRAVAVNGDGDNLSARKYYVVKVSDVLLPMTPAVGQLWKVTAESITVRTVTRGEARLTEVFINAKKARVIVPETENLFTRYIQSDSAFAGVGERLARRIWFKFKKEVYDLLENKDVERLKHVKGVTDKVANGLVAGWERYENLKQIAWFDKHDIPSGIARIIIKHHKADAVKAIEDDPYRLICFGLKFAEVDKLAMTNFAVQPNAYIRLRGAVEQALQARMMDGHTVSKHEQLMPLVETLLGSRELAVEALKAGYENTAFILSEKGNYHAVGQWIMEQVVAKRFAKLAMRKVWSSHYDQALNTALSTLTFPLTQKQDEAVKSALAHGISIIAGGAGTGKTTVLNVVLRAYQALGTDIRAMALSGRAAKRITEATSFPAQTITGFIKNVEKEPLGDRTLIVIDEASMVDLATMFKLVNLTKGRVRFLLVGDPKQLAPISAGLVLHEAVEAIPTVTLDVVKRQKGSTGIPEFTRLIVDKQVPEASMFNGNIVFHTCLAKDINERVTQLYKQQPQDTQIISAKYGGNGGIDVINELCQAACNPHGKKLRFDFNGAKNYLDLREYDPIIFVQNNWERGVQNGTLGTLMNVGAPKVEVEDGEISFADVQIDTGEVIPLTIDLIDSIRGAYSISLHKAQGSQFKRVIIPVTNSRMLDNAWIYTALTRAEVKIELVGSFKDFAGSIGRLSEADKRNTYLRELLLLEMAMLNAEAA